MKPLHVLLSILIIFSICILPACSISINPAKVISTAATAAQSPSEQELTSPAQLAGDNGQSAGAAPQFLRKSFDHYLVYYYAGSTPEIRLYQGIAYLGGNPVGMIEFYADGGTPIPGYTGIGSDQVIRVSYPLSEFTNIINILRYSSGTLNIFFNRGTMGIGTDSQQVGVT